MAFFRGNFSKTLTNTARVLEIKTREWAIEEKDNAVLDLAEHRKTLDERKTELSVDAEKWEQLLKELESFK